MYQEEGEEMTNANIDTSLLASIFSTFASVSATLAGLVFVAFTFKIQKTNIKTRNDRKKYKDIKEAMFYPLTNIILPMIMSLLLMTNKLPKGEFFDNYILENNPLFVFYFLLLVVCNARYAYIHHRQKFKHEACLGVMASLTTIIIYFSQWDYILIDLQSVLSIFLLSLLAGTYQAWSFIKNTYDFEKPSEDSE